MRIEKEYKLRRFALQIVQQLPEAKEEAIKVLEYARELVGWENGTTGELRRISPPPPPFPHI